MGNNTLEQPDNRDGGFTIVETLTAMGIICTALLLVWWGVSASMTGVSQSKGNVFFAMDLLRADRLIRDAAGEVQIPYWERRLNLQSGEDDLTIPWYRGVADNYLHLFPEDDALIMEIHCNDEETGSVLLKRNVLLRGIESLECRILRDDNQMPFGLAIDYEHRGKSFHTVAHFSSTPLNLGTL
jgi:hypothetical protein